MRKTPSLFMRNYDGDRLVRDEIVPGSEWVAAGEGVATRKWDGTCCLVRDGQLWKRYDAKKGKAFPPGFIAAQEADPVTGHHTGWIPVGDEPASKWHMEAWAAVGSLPDGTYELCGPRLQGNPENLSTHIFIRHGADVLADCPRTFDALKAYLATTDVEGVVWHHPDGRLVKIKTRDFGITRPVAVNLSKAEASREATAVRMSTVNQVLRILNDAGCSEAICERIRNEIV